MRGPVQVAGWIAAYLLLALAPLAVSFIQLDPGRGFWVNLSVAAGFVGLSLMGLQFVIAARGPRVGEAVGVDVLLQFHRQITVLATVLILAHPIILMIWDTRFLGLLNIVTAPVRAKFAVTSVFLLLVLVVTSLWRRRLRIRYEVWQLLHAALAVLIVITAVVHVLLIHYYVDQPWEKGLWIAYSALFVWIGIRVRIVKPLLRWKHRWKVVSVVPQPGSAYTITLEPMDRASHRKGFSFQPGQFAWIHSGRSPFAMDYHPFSISSSAEMPHRLQFTIKEEHGFTTRVKEFAEGQLVYLDGPWGHFTMERYEGPGFVFIATGVGITPVLSMAATLADRGDRRPCWMFVGNRSQNGIICRDQIDEAAARLDMTVVHVLSRPEAGWTGRTGHVGLEVLDEILPAARARLQYFICGNDAMMDSAEAALRTLGIPPAHVHSERFAMA